MVTMLWVLVMDIVVIMECATNVVVVVIMVIFFKFYGYYGYYGYHWLLPLYYGITIDNHR